MFSSTKFTVQLQKQKKENLVEIVATFLGFSSSVSKEGEDFYLYLFFIY